MTDIDIVVPWVDGSDPAWQAEKAACAGQAAGDARDIRYRDWDTLRYWFRGVERFAPWARRIHFVTWGHLPDWLDAGHERLHIVKHSDYIPPEYLPTFSANPIELNLHRIPGLAEQFVYFNDDTFLVGPVADTYWFRNGLPCDQAIIGTEPPNFRNSIAAMIDNGMEVINTTFKRGESMRRSPSHWFNVKYGKLNIFNLVSLLWEDFTGFMYAHFPNAYLRSTFETVWQEEYELLNATSLRKFRGKYDVNQYLMRNWQLASNQFVPRRQKGCAYYSMASAPDVLRAAILSGRYRILCLNDFDGDEDFESRKQALHDAFEELFPNKSAFEKQEPTA